MTVTRNPSALTLADLNTTINHEPRIKDVRIGERLGMARPTNIRQTIEANMAELERYGSVHAARAVIEVGKGASREITAYHLNEPQTLLLCMLSRTERAADVREEVISVYMAYRRGTLPQAEPASLSFDQQIEQMRQERMLMEKRRLMLKEVRALSPVDAHRLAQEWGYVTTAPQQPDLLPVKRNGLAFYILGDRLITCDTDDFRLRHGDRAVVLKGRVIETDTITERDDDWSGYLFRRPARAAYVDGPAANERSQIRVLGRVLSVEAL